MSSLEDRRHHAHAYCSSICERSNLFGCLLFLSALRGTWFWYTITRHHMKGWGWFLYIDLTLMLVLFTAIFLGAKGRLRELADLAKLLINLCIWVALYVPAAIIRLVGISIQFLLSKFCVFRLPRFRKKGSECIPGCVTGRGKLCFMCNRLIERSSLLTGTSWLLAPTKERHAHHTARDLLASSESCNLCKLLLQSISSHLHGSEEGTEQVAGSIFSPRCTNKPFSVVIWEQRYVCDGPSLSIALKGPCVSTANPLRVKIGALQHECDVSHDTGSQVVLKLCKQWVQSCCNHPVCQNPSLPSELGSFRPTRLLEINDENEIRLIETLDMSRYSPIQYTALSHCWGGHMDTKLLQDNYSSMKESIRITDLPKSFRDAISITRGLGAEYIWIDSLCILQDSVEDWDRESASMGLLYANALCTLSATASKNPEGGCFRERKHLSDDSLCVLRREGELALLVQQEKSQQVIIADLFDEYVEKAPLNLRGWPFQERVLAKRVLHFCDGLVLFECNTFQASEYHTDGVPYPKKANVRMDGKSHSVAEFVRLSEPDELYITERKKVWIKGVSTRPISRPAKGQWVMKTAIVRNPRYESLEEKSARYFRMSATRGKRGAFQLLLRFKGTEPAEKIEFHNSWYDMVEQYSERDLTLDKDKILAALGVADFIQKSADLIFLAGIWREFIPFNLLWTIGGPPRERPARVVPTWSWASVDGRISNKLKVNEEQVDTWREIVSWIHVGRVETLSKSANFILNATITLTGHLCKPEDLSGAEFLLDIANVDLDSSEEQFFCLPVLSFKNVHALPLGGGRQLHGLILRGKLDADECYERVGYFWIGQEEATKAVLSALPPTSSSIKLV